MGELPRTHVDGSLEEAEGLPYGLVRALTAGSRGSVRALLGVLSVALATFALLQALTYSANPGVLADSAGGVVRAVDENGFAWRDGIRPGQLVVSVIAADDLGGWRIETLDGAGLRRISSMSEVQAAMERTTIVALLALAIAAVGIIVAASAGAAAGLATATGAALAAIPLAAHGDARMSWVAIPAAAAIAGSRLAVDIRDRSARALVVSTTAIALGWSALSRIPELGLPGPDAVLWTITAISVAGLGILWARHGGAGGRPLARSTIAGDALLGLAASGLLVASTMSGWLTWPVTAAGCVVVLLLSPSGRRRAASLVDSAWLDGVRKTASVNALDEERSRVAADLHDAPLQEIAGVIARLEQVPAVDHERETLRTVSIHLRELVTGLEPPMLDQLGLVTALDYVAAQQAERGPRVTVAVRADSARPPHAVEVAAYRIAEEALRNAVNHSHAANVVISGEISRDHVTVHVADDGVGVGAAQPRGGLASMPARARAVGGRIKCLPRRNGGTIIAFEWQSS
jgi:signal transduction histidine kinase